MFNIAEHKAQLRAYFDGLGFERWSAIYGDHQLSPIRQTIREGHAQMLERALAWLDAGTLPRTVLDAGCGTGLFTQALAERGAHVTAVDIAPQMVEATAARLHSHGLARSATCAASDLEAVRGTFDLVACFDVLIHYPGAAFARLCGHLAQQSSNQLLITYAPYSPLLALLHRIGGFFPHSQRRTEIQMIKAEVVHAVLAAHGFVIEHEVHIRHRFYHVTLLGATRQGGSV